MGTQKVVGYVLGFEGVSNYPGMANMSHLFPRWAACAAQRFTEATGFECRVIGKEEVGYQPKDFLEAMRVRMLWPRLLPDADVAVCIDADALFFRPWDPRPFCTDGAVVAVRCRTWWNEALARWFASKSLDPHRVVAGFWAAPRSTAPMFEECADRWEELGPLALHDVGALSRVLQDHDHPVRFVDQRVQWKRWGRLASRVDLVAIHFGGFVYKHWDADAVPAARNDLPWDLEAMRERADGALLRDDGTAADGKGWFISGGREYRFDPEKDELCP